MLSAGPSDGLSAGPPVWDSARMLIAMAGLPAAGKSSVAEALGRVLPAPVVSVDPVEAAMWRAGVEHGQPTGLAAYLVAEAVADGVLALGQSVIVDAVNAVEAARRQWRTLAGRHGVPVVFLEVVCSDPAVHRRRLEGRSRDIPGFEEPTWEAVEETRAAFEPWTDRRLVLDALADPASNLAEAWAYVAAAAPPPRPAP
ncbi:Predicted kinase [Streptomyces griseoaurantiacus]|uniref:Predicted kinase n=2 Tax=Streptomyces griseoaurantiacus TaxID=68213 RepID=A0A1G7C0F9_9ACTN|nr:Predicted kinase [Streptomyces jietaisiensis]